METPVLKASRAAVRRAQEFFGSRGERVVTRFAPSPTGYLHLGHVASMIFVWGMGRALDAEIILRVEDHDRGRSRKEFEDAILADMAWLGFSPDRGVQEGGRPSQFRQSDQLRIYELAADQLRQRQLLYACECTRREIERTVDAARQLRAELYYPGTCKAKQLEFTEARGLRVVMPQETVVFDDAYLGAQRQVPADQCGDVLVRERSGSWTYHFAASVDDYQQAVNLVVRGQDLIASTGRQVILANYLGRKNRTLFLHHPLVRDPKNAGKKLSKRDASPAIAEQRKAGERADVILGAAALAVGLIDDLRPLSHAELLSLFKM